jgi:hypothetical protein
MPARKSTWTDRLTSWLKKPSPKVSVAPSRISRTEKMETCLEDPDGALQELQQEQRLIAQELEETFVAYDRKLRAMAERLAGRGKDRTTPSAAELARMRDEQTELWRLVRRAQASSRSTRQLERELMEWRGRSVSAVPVGHPNHPKTRLEIVQSELRTRGIERSVESAPALELKPVESLPVMQAQPDDEIFGDDDIEDTGPSWTHETDEHIMRELMSREREMAKLLTVPQNPEVIAELASMAHELRELHSHLRTHDRRERVKRVRWEVGIPS